MRMHFVKHNYHFWFPAVRGFSWRCHGDPLWNTFIRWNASEAYTVTDLNFILREPLSSACGSAKIAWRLTHRRYRKPWRSSLIEALTGRFLQPHLEDSTLPEFGGFWDNITHFHCLHGTAMERMNGLWTEGSPPQHGRLMPIKPTEQ